MSRLLQEALFWFSVGSATGLFVIAAVFAFAIAVPGLGGVDAVARAVAQGVDAVIDGSRKEEIRQPEEKGLLPLMGVRI